MNKKVKIVFFGTPEYVTSIPQALLDAGFNLIACVTASDRPVGRKKALTPSPVKVWANQNKIPVINSPSLEEITEKVKDLKPDIGVLAAYGKIIPKKLIDAFACGILVIHPSFLPNYRGASPVQAAIAAGDTEIGLSIIKMDEKMDHGPIVSQFKEKLPPDATPEIVYPKLFAEAAEVLVTILPAYMEGKIELREQNHSKATFCKILKKENGKIDWSKKPEEIERFIRAMKPWPGAWTEIKLAKEIKRLKILKAHLEEGKLVLGQVQLEGKKPVSWEQFKQGYPEVEIVE